jgi:hypothetical protein
MWICTFLKVVHLFELIHILAYMSETLCLAVLQLKWPEACSDRRWHCCYGCSWLSDVGKSAENCIWSIRWSGMLLAHTSSFFLFFIMFIHLKLGRIVYLMVLPHILLAKASYHVEPASHQWGCRSWD